MIILKNKQTDKLESTIYNFYYLQFKNNFMKKVLLSTILCFLVFMAISQVQGTIQQVVGTPNVVDILGKSPIVYNFPIKEFDFVLSIPSANSSGVTAAIVNSVLPAAGTWSTPAPFIVAGRTYYGFHYVNSANAINLPFGANTPVKMATVSFSNAVGSLIVRLTDEASAQIIFVTGTSYSTYWSLSANQTLGQDLLGKISAVPISGSVYYANASESTIGTATGSFQYVETNSTILPVVIANFNAVKVAGKVNITWSTATELNSASFVLERSNDVSSFLTLTIISAIGSGANSYTAVDQSPINGTSFYRLKNVDKDGTFTYSSIVKIDFDGNSMSVYPSPAHSYLNLNVTDASLFGTVASIIDISGKNLMALVIAGNSQKLNVSTLLPGIYFIKMSNGSSLKFIKQ